MWTSLSRVQNDKHETELKFSFAGFLGSLQVPEDHLAWHPPDVCLLMRQIHLSCPGYVVGEMIFFFLFFLIPFPVSLSSCSYFLPSYPSPPHPSATLCSSPISSSSSSSSPIRTHWDPGWPSACSHSTSILSGAGISAISHLTFQYEPESLEILNTSFSLYRFIFGSF